MDTTSLLTGIALALIIEGIFPFLAPTAWRRLFSQMLQNSDSALRATGLLGMLLGLLLLWLVR